MSWVIINKQTDAVVCELFDQSQVNALNTAKYEAVEAGEYLKNLNLQLNGGLTYRDKVEQGLLP